MAQPTIGARVDGVDGALLRIKQVHRKWAPRSWDVTVCARNNHHDMVERLIVTRYDVPSEEWYVDFDTQQEA